MKPKTGQRAYILFSHGRAIAVFDMAKEAKAEQLRLKARKIDATYWRRRNRLDAEQFAAWHNYEHDARFSTKG